MGNYTFVIILILFGFFILTSWIKVLREYERAVIFTLGRLAREPKGPGVVFIFAPFQKMVRVSLRTVVLDVPPQDVITRDNVSVKVNAVVYFRVFDPSKRSSKLKIFFTPLLSWPKRPCVRFLVRSNSTGYCRKGKR